MALQAQRKRSSLTLKRAQLKTLATKTKTPTPGTPLEYAKEILRAEALAISQLVNQLDTNFNLAVEAIVAISDRGRIVLSGMGKAGIVANKISATLAGVGLSSFYLNPTEALHGDLGRIAQSDVLILLSNSGETPEVLSILAHAKRIGCIVIAITAKTSSSLGTHANFTLTLGELSEAGPLGLAPTTSTTAMLALGDALAMSALNLLPFSKEKFAALHPAGSLGRALMLVSQVMRSGPALCVVPETLVMRDVLRQISKTSGRPGACAVTNKRGVLVGVFTDGDLRRCLERSEDFLTHQVKDFMGHSPKTIGPEKLVQEAIMLMNQFQIDQVLVIDKKNKPVGLIDIQDTIDLKISPHAGGSR